MENPRYRVSSPPTKEGNEPHFELSVTDRAVSPGVYSPPEKRTCVTAHHTRRRGYNPFFEVTG